MQTDADLLLKVNHLSARIGRQVILDDINFDVRRGECIALVGGSGAGKSTLLRCLMGLARPAIPFQGRIAFDGVTRSFANASQRYKADGLAFVPQNPDHGFDPLKRLKWQWQQAARLITGSKRFTATQQSLLSELGLESLERRYPHQWSRGMQQRLLVGMALIASPRLLILDEPTSALDPLIAAQVLQLVMRHADEHNIALLIVTHDLALAARYAARTAIMTTGRIVELGETRSLLSEPRTAYGQLLARNRDWNSVVNLQSSVPVAAE
ncbi:MAG: ATP-binding cassette domain-containing protein [Roseibium sp.]